MVSECPGYLLRVSMDADSVVPGRPVAAAIRSTVMAVVVSVLVVLIGPTIPANAAGALPVESSACSSKEFTTAIPVVKKVDKKTGTVTLARARSSKVATGSLVCRSGSWASDELKVIQARFGQWIYVPIDADRLTPRIDPSRFNVSLATVPCRLTFQTDALRTDAWTASLSWSRDSRSGRFLPSNRRVRGLILHLTDDPSAAREQDSPEIEGLNRMLRAAANDADDYWQSQSAGRFGLSFDIAPGIFYPGQPVQPTGSARQFVLRDQLVTLDDRIDFAGYDLVLATWPVIPNTGAAGEVVLIPTLGADGSQTQVLVMMDRDSTDSLPWLFKHEFAHTLGLPDLYGLPENFLDNRFVGNTTLMGKGSDYLTSYERWILGWVPDDAVLCVTKDGPGEAELAKLGDRSGSPTMAIYPISPTQAVVVEYRDEQLPSGVVDGPHLFVYWVNAASTSALSAGTGAEGQNIFSMRGAQDTSRTSTEFFRMHQSEPPMVNYRKDLEQLRRIPAYAAGDSRSYTEYLRDIGLSNRVGAANTDPFLAPGSDDAILEPWFGLTIPSAPRLAVRGAGSPGLTFSWNMIR